MSNLTYCQSNNRDNHHTIRSNISNAQVILLRVQFNDAMKSESDIIADNNFDLQNK